MGNHCYRLSEPGACYHLLGHLDQGSLYWDQLVWKHKIIVLQPLEPSGGGVLRISSDGDDRIRGKISPPPPKEKTPRPKINPQKSHAEFFRLKIKIVQLYIYRFCETDAMLCVMHLSM